VLPTLPDGAAVAWPGFTLRLGDTFGADDRDGIIRGLHRHDIGASNPYPVIPRLPCHARRRPEAPVEFPIAERIAQRTISLPFHLGLSSRDLDLTCQTLEVMIKRQTFRR
jgi:dTDP-4-amino-4,6-dideoxygalactose transaminase